MAPPIPGSTIRHRLLSLLFFTFIGSFLAENSPFKEHHSYYSNARSTSKNIEKTDIRDRGKIESVDGGESDTPRAPIELKSQPPRDEEEERIVVIKPRPPTEPNALQIGQQSDGLNKTQLEQEELAVATRIAVFFLFFWCFVCALG